MLTSTGLAMTPTFFCAMVGMLVLTALDQNPDLARNKKTRTILFCVLGVSFSLLCLLLLRLKPALPIMITLAAAAFLFQVPAYLRLRYPDRYRQNDRSPWMWRIRSHVSNGSPGGYLRKLERIQQSLRRRPLDPILHLKAMELALRCNENNRALYHCHVLDEVLSTGTAHEHVLRCQIYLLSHRQRRHEDAENVLQRLESLYPTDFPHDLPPQREESSASSGDGDS
jgi:hypothetical protein